ncbi:uncharacterized protein LOC111408305 [Olea europaea var. sylvestris]|uniref:uncharacterized protein LOC111408305 n=1 Tax=Olea europaea var. sylvestris TaxID=158386 RepID=UPI000C1CF943|nr:uncharacterized protein LOC111408305 [Olea europaea var. sylvestris]
MSSAFSGLPYHLPSKGFLDVNKRIWVIFKNLGPRFTGRNHNLFQELLTSILTRSKRVVSCESFDSGILEAWSAYMIAYCTMNNCTGARDTNKYFKNNNVNALDESEDELEIQHAHVNEVDDKDEAVDDITGLGIATQLQKALIKLDLDIDDIRGQGYDNGSNMSGKHKDNVQGLTVKLLSQTRWESHVESVKLIMEQTAQIRDALLDLAESNENPKVKCEVESLAAHELQNFDFLLGMIIWYKLLHAVNIVSKFLQTESMDIDHAIYLLQGLVSFLEEYREIGFAITKDEATKKQSAEESFRVECFVFIIDQTLSSPMTRFENFKQHDDTFGFLFTLKRLRIVAFSSLLNSCMILEKYLQHDGCSDISGDDLCSELQVLRCYIPSEATSAIEVL